MYNGELQPHELELIDTAKAVLPGDNLFFDERSTSSLETILLSIRNMKLRYGINGAVVDYMQILNVNQKNNSYTREQAMGDAARRLKNLAKDLGIWIIALSQLSRNQQDPVPTVSRLRDSGQIHEAADVVMLIYRPEVYNRTFPQPFDSLTDEECKGKAMIDVAKGRNIGIFKFLVEFNANTTHFIDMSLDDPSYETGPVEEDAPF
jgi:replicative DNA helicase